MLLAMLVAGALPAGATKRVTVAQLDQILSKATAAHRTDESITSIFGDLELTEQLDDDALNRIDTKLHLGPKTTMALQLLADQSAFLDAPVADRPPAAPAPDAEQRILNAARVYVSQTLPRLPDFIATRSTFRFDNSPQILKQNEWPVHAGLHLVGSSTHEITLLDDTGVPSPASRSVAASASAPMARPEPGLRTAGEFGPILALILLDTFKGKIGFHHWEQTHAGSLAVYRYAVPKSASHYTVDYCCVVGKPGVELRQGGRRGSGGVPPPTTLQDNLANHFHSLPAYHGSLLIDPASGAILRITMQAELDVDGPVTRADILIDYGPVLIGDRKFICPLRSLALTQGLAGTNSNFGIPPDTQINEASFTNYHRLGTSIRIIPESAEAKPPALEGQNPPTQPPPSLDPQQAVAPQSARAPPAPPSPDATPK
jgi:hypothetical protein